MIFEEQRIAGHVVNDTSDGWGSGAYDSSASEDSGFTIPPRNTAVIPDNTTYLREATGYVPFRRSDTSATFLIAENQVLVTFRDEASDKDVDNVHDWLIRGGAKKTGQIGGLKMVQYFLPPVQT